VSTLTVTRVVGGVPRLAEGAQSPAAGPFRFFTNWETLRIDEVFSDANARWKGRSVGELAAERGVDPFDAMLDLSLSEELRTSYMPAMPGDDEESWQKRAEVWRDPRTVIGASDAGAHLDMIDTFICTTALLCFVVFFYSDAVYDLLAPVFGLASGAGS